ncbi:DUF2637 domain-containing protein, partial [Streptomyces sp. NPDC028635]|uniref:DUF2637 domain-containing protein n=1 Tax=Streptomyces sp. NPDC028635 TaxID=3154800 RepID=UPI0033EF2BB9
AARHAIGRIADITADRHMEGVRLMRWVLSPLPTFLLWRRMKLWELRSYEQVIKLEQERLVYQARLRSRFGRAWRRKAPVESLMPLRLARYGVPLSETAPAGLAAAGIEPAGHTEPESPAPAVPVAETVRRIRRGTGDLRLALPAPAAAPEPAGEPAEPESPLRPGETPEAAADRFADPYRAFVDQFRVAPTTAQWAFWLHDRYGMSTTSGTPFPEAPLGPLLQVLRRRHGDVPEETEPGTPAATAASDDHRAYAEARP